MGLTFEDRELRPLTADEVQRMVEVGLLDAHERVELLHGVLTRMSRKSPAHVVVQRRLVKWLVLGEDAGGYEVAGEPSLCVPDETSLPAPGVAVVGRFDPHELPTTALLLIEVSVSSLRIDTKIKPPLYAATGTPEYWVVDVPRRRVLVLTEPGPAGYARTEEHGPGEHLTPVAVDVEPLDLAALFARLD